MSDNYYVVQLKLATNKNDIEALEKRFYYAEIIYNQVIKYCRRQYNKMIRDSRYKEASGKDRTALIKEYKLTKFQLFNYSKIIGKKYKRYLDSKVVQCISKHVYRSVYSVLYGKGKHIHFKKHGDLDTIETDTNFNRLRYENGVLIFNNIKIKVRNNSINNPYINESLSKNIKYCRVKRLPFSTGYRYYVQLIIEGLPPGKNILGKGDVGIDIGTSTIAVCSNKELILKELAPLNGKYVSEIKKLQNELERSRRSLNKDNYNKDGTIKKGKLKWVFSKSYRKVRMRLKTLFRKRSAYIKQCHEILVNKVITLGNMFYIEDMNFSALQRKAKKSNTNKKRKRFGLSLQKRAPALLVSIIDRKLKYSGSSIKKVNTRTFKASQYNHIDNTYVPKKLYERSTIIDGIWIQRDLYSSFLLMNSKNDLLTTDRDKCINTFNIFLELHNKLITEIMESGISRPSCFGF